MSNEKKGGGCFSILMMACLFMLIMQFFNKPKQEETLPPKPQEQQTAVLPADLPKAEAVLAKLPNDLKEAGKKAIPPQFITLGSVDPKSPYRMMITLSNRGAGVARIELNEKNYLDTQDKTGYFGQIIVDESLVQKEIKEGKKGVAVQVVGAGTPAQKAGLKAGDRILAVKAKGMDRTVVDSFIVLREYLLKTKPGDSIDLEIQRGDKKQTLVCNLDHAPTSILRPEAFLRTYNDYKNLVGLQGVSQNVDEEAELLDPYSSVKRKENNSPFSFLLTLASYDDKEKLNWYPDMQEAKSVQDAPRDPAIEAELASVEMRNGYWDYLPGASSETTAVFRKILLNRQMEIRKTFSLVKGEPADQEGRKKEDAPEYHLTMKVEFRNLDPEKAHKFSFVLDGPNGLPTEGAWYAAGRKTGPGWGSYGLRDLIVQMSGKTPVVVKCTDIAQKRLLPSDQVVLDFIGLDSQYFECTMIPNEKENRSWLESYSPLRVGARIKETPSFANVSFRMKSLEKELAPYQKEGDSISHEFQIFAGPKQPGLLENYGLGDTIIYGWFWFVSIPLLAILHFFKTYLVFNYGLAIILLTIVVRLCLFPLSLKQIVSSLKMQQIQPEIAKLKEKYKDDQQGMMRAQQELFRKSGVNPLGGCLPLLIQLPIFIGLYKALSLDVNLYGVPLFGSGVRLCSNLSAPDMLIDWSNMWNSMGCFGFNMGQGMFYLGPYFNLLPMLTIVLFLVQQKFLMPPVVGNDESAQQQRTMRFMMNFMMIFMGFMFFKVPSGLCIYFIVSSLWGILERQFHPKLEDISIAADLSDNSGAARTTAAKSKAPVSQVKNSRDRRKQYAGKTEQEKPKGKFRLWLEDILKKAQEQQKLAKAEKDKRDRKKR
ncbi:MAG: YidC/Oxa1 family insertase periplasmic-domain containing protein [Planctomycetia bacterium]|nr:YidC/Oxa1 family insertase periplasmic-domain containing protein [Planctomycetia bacterium]